MSFSDHFSSLASRYAAFRPSYPDDLFAWLASVAPAQDAVWDCACGSGQASKKLARYFAHVIATDASEEQLGEAEPDPKIEYRVALAEKSGLPDASVDLVTVAQAAHWFRHKEFYAEVRRVLKPKGVIALWTYDLLTLQDKKIMENLQAFFETVEPFWPPERAYVSSGYRTLPFPFADEIEAPEMSMEVDWTLEHLMGYFRSWSSVKYYKAENKIDPVDRIEADLKPLWPAGEARRVHFSLYVRAARV